MDHTTSETVRWARKLGLTLECCARRPREAGFWTRTICRSKQQSVSRLGAVTVNWLYLLECERARCAMQGVHIFDQGLLQALWSIAYSARALDLGSPRLRARLRAALPRSLTVVLVTADLTIIRRRLARRRGGDSRVERDMAVRPVDAALDRAADVLAGVETIARELASEGRARLITVRSQDDSLSLNTAIVCRALLPELSELHGDRTHLLDAGGCRVSAGAS
jgi:hypothetical protein